MKKFFPPIRFTKKIAAAKKRGHPIVALESTVITHGLPQPDNLALAQEMEAIVEKTGATPATIAVLNGQIRVGLDRGDLEKLARMKTSRKISSRDFGPALLDKASGGTTVAGTLAVAKLAGISVFATGGIGGVHREPNFDISADLTALGKTPVIVVCSGAKAILNLPATVEYLETLGIPVIGYRTDEFPAFFSPTSGLAVSARADDPEAVMAIARAHWGIGQRSALLVVVPPPKKVALGVSEMEFAVKEALRQAEIEEITGPQVTPFLLARVSQLTGKDSLKANLALLKKNAKIAGMIARKIAESDQRSSLNI